MVNRGPTMLVTDSQKDTSARPLMRPRICRVSEFIGLILPGGGVRISVIGFVTSARSIRCRVVRPQPPINATIAMRTKNCFIPPEHGTSRDCFSCVRQVSREVALRIYFVVICGLLCGCARGKIDVGSPAPSQLTSDRSISVNVAGAVNEPGWHLLKPPFTVKQAINEAGGIDKFERGQSQSVRVIHLNGTTTIVRLERYDAAVLEDGDRLYVRRHLF